MELHLTLKGNICLPMAYRHSIQGFLYGLLAADPVYAEDLHNGRENAEGRQFKLFTFSQLEGIYSAKDGHITFPCGASLEVRSMEDAFLLRLLAALPVGKEVTLGDNRCKVTRCCLESKTLDRGAMEVSTRSPVVAYTTDEKGYTHFYAPDSVEFADLVEKNAHRKYKMYYGVEEAPKLQITCLGDVRKQVTTFKTTRITAWHGRFRLESTREMLALLYHTGLGAKSSQGFGMYQIR